MRNDVLAGLTLMAGVMAVSTGAILVKLCDLNPLSVGAYRLSLALPLFWLAAERVDPGWRGRIRKDQMGFLALSGVMLGLHFATWVASLSFTSVTSSVVLVTTNPIFVGIGSVLLLKEKVSARLWAGTFIAFAGTVVVAFGSSLPATAAPNPPLGNALALFGAVCMSGYLLVGRRLSGELPTVCYVTSVYTVAALTLWLGVLLTSAPTHGFSGKQWILLAMMALIPQGIGHTLLNRSLRVLPASMVAVAILGEPVFATLAAIPILNEYPTPTHIGGGLLVILGVGLAVSAGKRRTPE
ncbi:MAG: DMT family transporter [Candidatus Eremiobacteraeota bacterium]|nr:DMT family transporter [Candidatus Eremiobacteraeota bacterium]